EGFSKVQFPNIDIGASRSTTIEIQLSLAVEEEISVTAESPLLDERKLAPGTTITQLELNKIPAGRNPYALLTQSPGLLIEQVHVGDGASGGNTKVRSQAGETSENDFLLDGLPVNSAIYGGAGVPTVLFDPEQLEEFQVVVGGNDMSKNSAGVSVSVVTKRGSNEFRGSARFLVSDKDGYFGVLKQAEPGFDSSDLGAGQEDFVGNSIERIQDYGFEAGGPAWRDRLWLWGTWGVRDSSIILNGGEAGRAIFEATVLKLNAQPSAANSFVVSYNNGERPTVATAGGQNRDLSATRNRDSESGITILEDTQVFGSKLVASGTYSHIDAGYVLRANGGAGRDRPATPEPGGEYNVDANGYQTNSSSFGQDSPSEELRLDLSYFVNTGMVSHEIRFGGRLRRADSIDIGSYPGRALLHYDGGYAGVQDPELLEVFGLPPARFEDAGFLYAYRAGVAPVSNDYRSLWVQVTLTWSRWTVNAGLRYDHQDGENKPATTAANPGFPEVMPAIEFEGNNGGLSWSSVVPRFGLTYALGQERKTLLRSSLSQFPSTMAFQDIHRINPADSQFASILFLDEPGGFSGFYDDGEPFAVLGGLFGFDPDNPTAISSSNLNDPNMKPEITTELVLGVEHAFLPQFVVGGRVTWRRRSNVAEEQPLFRNQTSGQIQTAGLGDYVFDRTLQGLLPDGSPYAIDTFAVDPSLASTGGSLLTDGGREVDSYGAAVTFTKRLSNQWMMRGFVNYFFKEDWSVPPSYFDHNDPNKFVSGENRDGAPVVEIFDRGTSALSSTWQWNVNGMYQVAPERVWGFNIAANLTGRQGYPIPYSRFITGSDGITRIIGVADSVTDFRYDDIFTADVRWEKEFAASSDTSLTFSIDGFNIFNTGTVISRENNVLSNREGWILGTVNPRIWRLGVRLNWR
ncbi:MAG: TonB-dependent receptor plug domain-containing protein, partial [Acidobacteriota bacterium]